MKNRIKWMLVGLGFTLGMQVIISLIFTGVAYGARYNVLNPQENSLVLFMLGLSLGAFLVGGFVEGWMNEELRLPDAAIIAVVTLLLNGLIFAILPFDRKIQFISGAWLSNQDGVIFFHMQGLIFAVLAIGVAVFGAYLGWHMTVPAEGRMDRIALLIGLIGAIVGPFLLLSLGGRDPSNPSRPGLPWHFLLIVLVAVLLIIAVGFFKFTRETGGSEDISISPERHRQG